MARPCPNRKKVRTGGGPRQAPVPPKMGEAKPSGGGEAGGNVGGRARDHATTPPPLVRHHCPHHQQAPTSADASRGRGRASRIFPFLIGRATTRRLTRMPSVVVREMAATQLEERHADWGYSRPVVTLEDLVWSLAFVLVSCSVLLAMAREWPSTPVKVWILRYTLHCLVHVRIHVLRVPEAAEEEREGEVSMGGGCGGDEEEEEGCEESWRSRVMKKVESTNAVISLFWWMLGFYWIVVGGHN